jgi:hypothetical protein
MPKRLRKWNDLAHAAEWLREQTGEDWEALDLANVGSPGGLHLYVHFRLPPDFKLPPDQPPNLSEGVMAEIVFNQDLDRLTQADEFLLKLLRFGEGEHAKHLKFDPGLPCTLDEIRVKEADLLTFLSSIKSLNAPGKASKVDAKKEKIRAILGKIEAADCEFSRDAMQGRKADFFDLCKILERESFIYIAQATFDDYLPGLCKFMPGARETNFYRDIAAKLG